MNAPISPYDIELGIIDLCEALEKETEQYAQLSELAAESEAKYKLIYSKTHVQMASNENGRMTVNEKQARADLIANDQFRIYRIYEARRAASREALLSLRARLDAMRTLSANLRIQT